MDYRAIHDESENKSVFIGLGLTSRKNLCVNPIVSKEKGLNAVDIGCKKLTASFVREKARKDRGASSSCSFFENLESADDSAAMPAGVYTLEDLKGLMNI